MPRKPLWKKVEKSEDELIEWFKALPYDVKRYLYAYYIGYLLAMADIKPSQVKRL